LLAEAGDKNTAGKEKPDKFEMRKMTISTKVINHRSRQSGKWEHLHLDTLLDPNLLLLWKMRYFTKDSAGRAGWDENTALIT